MSESPPAHAFNYLTLLTFEATLCKGFEGEKGVTKRLGWPTMKTMMRCLVLIAMFILGSAQLAQANDLAEALNFARNLMGDEAIEGYEEFVDYDPTEALPILLARDVKPTKTPDRPLDRGEVFRIHTQTGTPHFDSLGEARLSYVQLKPHIGRASRATGLPAALIDAVIRTESGYRPHAVSRSGARGLMQLMPTTAYEVGVRDAFDPADNIMGGSRYLRKLYDQFGSLEKAVAAYNAGPGAVSRHGGVPPYPETKRYVAAVLSRYRNSTVR